MCGIAGVVGKRDLVSAKEEVGLMQNALQHRGPNDAGIEAWDLAVLGHRRLSILDLSLAGHQPMLSPDGELGIVFNGAIYNFLILRDELQSKGYKFNSQTDTEVLLHGFREWGVDKLVERIEGMFAFALWDNRHETLYLVRDRLGVKPLVYSTRNGELAFASSIRALKCAGYGGDPDKRAMTEYLEFGFVTDDLSIYEGIEKLPVATILEWNRGEIRTRKYWDLSESKDEKISFEDAVEETERLFLEAVEKRLQADVPIGALLSGGIDSSLICWALAKLGSDVTAFTVSIPNDEWDESGAAIQTAKKLGIKHRILEMSGDDSFDANELSRAYAEPFACASALGLLSVSREIASSATVLLTGDGGDDVFLGYPEHRHFRLAEKVAQNTPGGIDSALQKAVSIFPKKGVIKRAGSFLSYSFGGLGAVTQARDGLPVYENNDLLGARLTGYVFPHREIPLTSGKNLLSDFLVYDRKTRFTGEYLPKVDGGTMFYALEARSPFLDIKLWEFACTLPYSLRLRKNTLKAVLREIVSRRIDPELARAKKQGFGVPAQRWLVRKWRPLFEEMMSDSLLEKDGWIKSRSALKMIDNAAVGNWAPRQLWFIFVLEAWLRFEKNLYD